MHRVMVQVAKATLKLAKEGHFSDPPGVPMYMECGKDKDDLRLFQSVRGTNGVEGYHQKILGVFGPTIIGQFGRVGGAGVCVRMRVC
jgi:hypothetical protein